MPKRARASSCSSRRRFASKRRHRRARPAAAVVHRGVAAWTGFPAPGTGFAGCFLQVFLRGQQRIRPLLPRRSPGPCTAHATTAAQARRRVGADLHRVRRPKRARAATTALHIAIQSGPAPRKPTPIGRPARLSQLPRKEITTEGRPGPDSAGCAPQLHRYNHRHRRRRPSPAMPRSPARPGPPEPPYPGRTADRRPGRRAMRPRRARPTRPACAAAGTGSACEKTLPPRPGQTRALRQDVECAHAREAARRHQRREDPRFHERVQPEGDINEHRKGAPPGPATHPAGARPAAPGRAAAAESREE